MHFCLTGYLVLFVVEEIVFSWARKFKLARLVIHLLRYHQFRWDFKDSKRFYLMCCLKSPPAYFKTIFIEHLLGQAGLCKVPRTQDALWKCILHRNGFALSSKLPPQFFQHTWLLIVFCNLSRSLSVSLSLFLSHTCSPDSLASFVPASHSLFPDSLTLFESAVWHCPGTTSCSCKAPYPRSQQVRNDLPHLGRDLQWMRGFWILHQFLEGKDRMICPCLLRTHQAWI